MCRSNLNIQMVTVMFIVFLQIPLTEQLELLSFLALQLIPLQIITFML